MIGIPNLDRMSQCELREYWVKYNTVTPEVAFKVIGNIKNNVRVVEMSASYAMAKAYSMDLRAEEQVAKAEAWESISKTFFKQIPREVRW